MTPKDGTECTAVTPADAEDALEAVNAKAGEGSETSARTAQLDKPEFKKPTLKPYKPPETEEEKAERTAWIEVELLDSLGNPVPGEWYRIVTPQETVAEGSLDAKGFVRLEGIKPGTCKVSFPGYDGRSWKKK